jgi:plasmid stabilization system protein ParE
MTSYSYHVEAEAEYRAAFRWFGASSLRAALGFERAVEDAIQKITAMPQAYPVVDRRHRMFKLKNYSYHLVYREEAGGVLIVAVAHDARRLGYWKGR